MSPRPLSAIVVAVVLGFAVLPSAATAEGADAAEKASKFTPRQLEHFEKKIRPLLVKRCYECHSRSAKKLQGGLRLDSRSKAVAGGDSGPAVEPGDLDSSLLVEAIGYTGELKMPPGSKLPADEIKLLVDWVQDGAPWPAEPNDPGAGVKLAAFDLKQRVADHWAWHPVKVTPPPAVPEKWRNWPTSPADQYILAKILAAKLTPAEPAGRRTLLRRVYFDLIGLPPSPAEIEAFLADHSPDAYEKVVDRLLASPHFGERWGRHWLDLVRYAESRGHEFDYDAPNAYQYRDYVIRALNTDVPYDRFVTEHIAGDLLPEPRLHPTEDFNESIIGTGFWHLGEWVHSPVDIRKDETDRQDNMLDVFGKTFMGMTIACARCHDHKFDAILQADYYAMAGYLQSSGYRLARFDSLSHNRRVAGQLDELRRRSAAEIARAALEARRPVLDRLDAYLLAARETIQAGPLASVAEKEKKTPPRKPRPDYDARAAEVATKRGLDGGVLAAWTRHLLAVKDDTGDPLHAWAKIAAGGDDLDGDDLDGDDLNDDGGKRLAELLRPVVDAWNAKRAAADAALKDANVIVDYATAGAGDWIADGVAFGLGPERPGDLRLGSDPARPIAGVATFGAARRDAAFANLQLAGGAQKDVGRIGGWVRAGQTVRTPTFTVLQGQVYYLVQGAGYAFAEVDSHRMLNGPLHGAVTTEWNGDQRGRPRWVAHDLSRYKGHRVHVELTPKGGGDVAVLMVVQSPHAPGDPTDRGPAPALADALTKSGAKSPQAVAETIARTLVDVAGRLAEGRLAGADSKAAADAAPLADWMVRHGELFTPSAGGEAAKKLAAAADSYIAESKTLHGQIKRQSRLAMAMWDGSPENEHLLIRGSAANPGDEVPRRLPMALGGDLPPKTARGSGRLDLARHLTDAANPLTARLMVNRLWHHLFGRGIVASVDNFGVLGERPTHPQLLDYLADRFVRDGWSVKRAIRHLVLSRTYQMSSRPTADGGRLDPGNLLLHRMRIRRLQGEVIRDAMLAVSGRLDRRMFGPSVPVYLTPFMTGRGRPGSGPLDGSGRRSIYVSIRRNFLSPMMLAFDMPRPFSSMGRRTVSNVPAQALILMNDPLVIQQAQLWAKNVLAEKDLAPPRRIERMYETAFARPPSETELADALAFLDEQAHRHGIPADQRDTALPPWADLCHVLFNVKQFIFVN